jgi:RNA polymerase sigma factor (sigma-70 family)
MEERPAPALPVSLPTKTILDAQRGDALAVHQLIEALAPYVGRICGAIALDDGQDAAQEALIIVFKNLRRLREPAALVGWVRTIATREAIRIARRRMPSDDTTMLAELPDLRQPELQVDLRGVLERLSPEHRAVLVLHAYGDMEESAIAELLAVSPGTVKSRLHRARSRFRKEWQS